MLRSYMPIHGMQAFRAAGLGEQFDTISAPVES
jgi:hypothetical protein